MIFVDEMINNRVMRKPFLLPFDDTKKREGGLAVLLAPSYEDSKEIINHKLFINKYYKSYFMERNCLYYIQQDGTSLDIQKESSFITEDSLYNGNRLQKIYYKGIDYDISAVSKELNHKLIEKIHSNFCETVKYPITVDIYHRLDIPYNQKYISVSTPEYIDNQIYYNYKLYCAFRTALYVIDKINPDCVNSLKYATAIVASGLFEKIKVYFNFNKNLKELCIAIYNYLYGDAANKDRIYKNKEIKINKDRMRKFKEDILKCKSIDELNNKINKGLLGDLGEASKSVINYILDVKFNFNKGIALSLYESSIDDVDELSKYYSINNEEVIYFDKNRIMILSEDASNNTQIKKMFYNDRMSNNKELLAHYKKVKQDCEKIKYTYSTFDLYKRKNLFVDASFYLNLFNRNCTFTKKRKMNIYIDIIERMIQDKRYSSYNKKTVIIPLFGQEFLNKPNYWLLNNDVNIVSTIYSLLMNDPAKLTSLFDGYNILFLGKDKYVKMNFSSEKILNYGLFLKTIKRVLSNEPLETSEDDNYISPKVIKTNIIDRVEKSQRVTIDNIVPVKLADDATDKEKTKQKLVEKIDNSANTKTNIDDTVEDIDDNETRDMLADLSMEPDDGPNISAARASRILKIQNDLLDKEFKGQTLGEILDASDMDESEIPPTSLSIDSVNPEWEDLKYDASKKLYELDKDIVNIFNNIANSNTSKYPLYLYDLQVEDTSTSEDAVETYTAKYESVDGKRFTITVDIPKFIDGKYMLLRGNRKCISNQLFLMPIIKTDVDTVQVVSCYNKIFIRRFGGVNGKSCVTSDRFIKTITKNKISGISYKPGDNSIVCKKYELPMDYIDMASVLDTVTIADSTIYFNQDKLRQLYKIDEKKGLPIGYNNENKFVIYYNPSNDYTFSSFLKDFAIASVKDFEKAYNATSVATKYTFSRASIMNSDIPLIVICAYHEGMEKVLKKANIKYKLFEKRPTYNKDMKDLIKFNDGYLLYDITYSSSLLMNGLKICDTENYSIAEINKKPMYIDFLNSITNRNVTDGLDNFYLMMIDVPITYNTLKHYKLPTDYIEVLLYANELLTDNKYIKHTDISSSRRIRREEQIADFLYKSLSVAYGRYYYNKNHGIDAEFSMKQSAVVDATLINNTTEDDSVLNALYEYESQNMVTPKGPSGMNSERSYGLDKRAYDESMKDVLSMSTGFASTVGINRQATIDANVRGARGYITNNNVNNEEINNIKSLCMTEAITPFATTRDDPFRTAMTYVQTSKHSMRCKRSDPLLVTSGADEALPYLISNTFAYKAKYDGKVIEKTDNYMIIEYNIKKDKNGNPLDQPIREFINLEDTIEKNSSSGFYIDLKLDTNLKEGSKFKANDILAQDNLSFTNNVGATDNLAYNLGPLKKFAILYTDEAFEDSAIISSSLADDLTSDVVLMKQMNLPKNTTIFNLITKGTHVQEGDELVVIQNSFDDEDTIALLQTLLDEDDDEDFSELGRIPVKAKVTGVVQDIKMYRTVPLDELSPSLKKAFKEYEKDINNKKEKMKEYGINYNSLPATTELPATGKLKNSEDGVVIEFYIKYTDKMSVGDKLIYYAALKGVVKNIFPDGKEPYSEFRPNEKIHSMESVGGVNARIVTSILITGALNKLMIELDRKCKDVIGVKYNDGLE